MDVNAIIGGAATQPTQTNAAIPGAPPATPAATNEGFGPAGLYTPSATTQNFTVDQNRVRELWTDHEARVASFRRMIETLLNQQAERQSLAEGWSLRDIEITDEMRAEANAMIEYGGYFSVENTAGRILEFAVALSGGDPSRIDLLERAVERAFRNVERMFGGDMPQISHDTLAAVREGFQQWRENGNAADITLLQR